MSATGDIRDRIAQYARAMGYIVTLDHASESHSAYVECSHEDAVHSLKIRVSDHDPRYHCDVDVSPSGAEWWQAVERLANEIGAPIPAPVRAARTRSEKARASALAAQRAAEEAVAVAMQTRNDLDARVAAAFPAEWAAAEARTGVDRREAKRLLRRRFECGSVV